MTRRKGDDQLPAKNDAKDNSRHGWPWMFILVLLIAAIIVLYALAQVGPAH